jgi:GTP-binding protein LepA
MEGNLKVKDKINFMFSGMDYEVIKLAVHRPFYSEVSELGAGEVGMICEIKVN